MPALANGRQEKAAELRSKGATQRDAYEQAGFTYSTAAASNFFKRPTIAARVRELMQAQEARKAKVAQKAADSAGVSREWVIERLKYVAEVAIRGAPVRDKKTGAPALDEQGKQIFDGKMQLNAATRALQLLGIDIGMFVQRHEVGDPGEFARLSNEELMEKMRKDMAAIGVDPDSAEILLAQFDEDTITLGEA